MKTKIRSLWLCVAFIASAPGHAAAPSAAPPASRDPLAWLGPLPHSLTETSANQAYEKAMKKALTEVAPHVAKSSAQAFACRKPSEVGPAPSLDAVDRYITELPDSKHGGPALDGLFRAAMQGNWLARGWVFNYLSAQERHTPEAIYRMAQLADWMRENKSGVLYAFLAKDFGDTPLYPRLPDGKPAREKFETYAALHNSYPLQFEVGRRLKSGQDPQMLSLGQKMMECATGALPGYRKVLQGTAGQP